MEMVKFELEYVLNTSVKILYPRLSSPSGLSDWFADNVDVNGEIYTFHWESSEQQAKLIFKRRDKAIRFSWLDEEDENCYFEFKIKVDELTNEVALIISDFAEEDEVEDSKNLWDKQITRMRNNLGM
jgi:hypothetical protein